MPKRKLTREQIAEMIAAYIEWRDSESPAPIETVAARFGVGKQTLYSYLRGHGVPNRDAIGTSYVQTDDAVVARIRALDEAAETRAAMPHRMFVLERRLRHLEWLLIEKGVVHLFEITPPSADEPRDRDTD